MSRAARRPIALAASTIAIAVAFLLPASAIAVQTFPDPFGGDGIHSDIRAGSQGTDIGDAFFLREEDVLQIRMFLDPPNTFIETHVCLSAEAFTRRIPPGLCQFHADGPASDTYELNLPPASFPVGTVEFDDPLGAFCAQVHVKYRAPGLAITRDGGGSAFAGWESGFPFFGSICFPSVPDPEPPGEGTAVVTKTGAFVGGDVVFTVTATNPTTETASNVVVWEALPPTLTWTLPAGCVLGPADLIARCPIGDLGEGESVELVFSATPPEDVCGTFSNHASTFIGRAVASSVDFASVDVPCPPEPEPDPLVLLTKEPSAIEVTVPGPITYIMTFENAGPGAATNVTVTDELPAGVEWSIGSGSEVCVIEGKTLTCSAENVPDGVFEVLEITGTIDATACGTMDNQGTAEFSGGPESGSITAISEPVDVTGCSGEAPSETTEPGPSGGAGGGGEGDGGLPNTSAAAPPPIGLTAVAVAFAIAASVLMLRPRRRD
jgi:uncharacterized repeat protein (TIGR01451 family)